jgi:hypothetical protein
MCLTADEVAAGVVQRQRWLARLALAVVLVVAAVVRLTALATNPPGLHGDEAITGIEGGRILQEGWIGLYSPLALGQPSGPLHATALSLVLFGQTIFAVRVVAAVAGIATVAALYILLRQNADEETALASSLVLATLGWAVHFSRVGFPVAFWPLAVILAATALLEGIRRRSPFWWALAGVLAGGGLYIYNAHPLPLVLLAGFGIAWLVHAGLAQRTPAGAVARREALAFGAGLTVSILPMALYAISPGGLYLQRLAGPSITRSAEWIDAVGWADRLSLLAARYGGYWQRVCCTPQFDGVDGSGLSPLLPLPFLVLAVIGMVASLKRPWKPWAMLGVLMAAALPLAPVMTVEGGARRSLVLAPFLAAFAGYGAVWLWRIAQREGRLEQAIVGAGLAVLLIWGAAQDLTVELRRMPHAQESVSTFGLPMAEAARYLDGLPPHTRVRWYSSRWPAWFETRRFLAPDVVIVDGSREFGDGSFARGAGDGTQVFLLLDAYLPDVARLERRYPGGEVVESGPADAPHFIAYIVDPASQGGSGNQDQTAVQPPSTGRAMPVTIRAPGETR